MGNLYIGNNPILEVPDLSDVVSSSDFEEAVKVTANALTSLKETKADASTSVKKSDFDSFKSTTNSSLASMARANQVYTKAEIDETDRVIADALTSINVRVQTCEASIGTLETGGGSGGSGEAFDPADISAALDDLSERLLDTSTKLGALIEYTDENLETIDSSLDDHEERIKVLEASTFDGSVSFSKLSELENDCYFKPITYITKDAYDDLVDDDEVDEDTMYVITDLASTDDLATLVSIEDLNAAKASINASLNDTANEVINAANTSIGYWKTTHVNAANNSINSYKNSAVSAVQSQQTTSVNAVNSAKTTAISDISTAAESIAANMKDFVVISDASYAEIQNPNANTIYFITT